jgi:rhomboid family GlyGly-CTERM serine protease
MPVDAGFTKLTWSPRLPSSSLGWALVFAALLVVLQVLPEPARQALWYSRDGVVAGEYWRLLTGNLVHLGWAHLALNVGALLVGIFIFYPGRTPVAWALAMATCGVATNLGLWWFNPEITWCVGMSGALHGLLIIGAIDWARRGDPVGVVLLAIWIAKLAWEHWNGALPLSTETVGGRVVTAAHLWGAIGGVLWLAFETAARRHGWRL